MINILQLVVIAAGILLLCMDFISFVYQKVTESIGMMWGIFAVILILTGAVPGLSGWTKVVPREAYGAVIVIGLSMILGCFFLSSHVSRLIRKNQELAMQVSLLNQENERILSELEALTGKNKVRI